MKKTATLFNKEACTLACGVNPEFYPSRQKHTILYISHPFSPEYLKWNGITEQPAMSVKGSNLELDKAWKKYNKAEIAIEKAIIDKAVEEGLIDFELASALKWSKKAGCSCGCSPGWKGVRDYRRQSMWITVKSSFEEKEEQRNMQEQSSWREAETLASMVI